MLNKAHSPWTDLPVFQHRIAQKFFTDLSQYVWSNFHEMYQVMLMHNPTKEAQAINLLKMLQVIDGLDDESMTQEADKSLRLYAGMDQTYQVVMQLHVRDMLPTLSLQNVRIMTYKYFLKKFYGHLLHNNDSSPLLGGGLRGYSQFMTTGAYFDATQYSARQEFHKTAFASAILDAVKVDDEGMKHLAERRTAQMPAALPALLTQGLAQGPGQAPARAPAAAQAGVPGSAPATPRAADAAQGKPREAAKTKDAVKEAPARVRERAAEAPQPPTRPAPLFNRPSRTAESGNGGGGGLFKDAVQNRLQLLNSGVETPTRSRPASAPRSPSVTPAQAVQAAQPAAEARAASAQASGDTVPVLPAAPPAALPAALPVASPVPPPQPPSAVVQSALSQVGAFVPQVAAAAPAPVFAAQPVPAVLQVAPAQPDAKSALSEAVLLEMYRRLQSLPSPGEPAAKNETIETPRSPRTKASARPEARAPKGRRRSTDSAASAASAASASSQPRTRERSPARSEARSTTSSLGRRDDVLTVVMPSSRRSLHPVPAGTFGGAAEPRPHEDRAFKDHIDRLRASDSTRPAPKRDTREASEEEDDEDADFDNPEQSEDDDADAEEFGSDLEP